MFYKGLAIAVLIFASSTAESATCTNKAYVTGFLSVPDGTLSEIDLTTNMGVSPNIALPGSVSPAGIAITSDGNRAFIANFTTNNVSVVDLTTTPPTFVQNIALPAGAMGPQDLVITPDGHWALITNNTSGNISVLDLSVMPPVFLPANISLGGATQTTIVAITPAGDYAYATNQGTDNVSQISLTGPTPAFVQNIALPLGSSRPTGIAISLDGQTAYVTNQMSADVSRIDLSVMPPVSFPVNIPLPMGTMSPGFIAIAATPMGDYGLIANAGSNDLSILDLQTNTALPNVALPMGSISAQFVAVMPDYTTAYVTSIGSNTIAVVDLTALPFTSTVAITFPPGPPTATGPGGIAIAPCSSVIPGSVQATPKANRYFWESDIYNTIAWTPPLNITPQGYLIYRDGGLLAQVSNSSLAYEDHLLDETTVYTYSVYAITGSGNTLIGTVSVTTKKG